MNKQKKTDPVKIIYILAGIFVIVWSVHKYSLGVNKNFFFGQFAVIGVIMMFISMFSRMQRKIRAEKVELALEDGEYAKAAVLMDSYIRDEKVPAQTYLGRGFLALLQNDDKTIEDLLSLYEKEIEKADRYVLDIILAAIYAKKGDTVLANQKLGEVSFDFSSMLNKDFYLGLTDDLKDYISAITEISLGRMKEAEKIMKKREKNALAGAYEGIMDLLWENLRDGKVYVLPKYTGETGEKKIIGKMTRTVVFLILAAIVLMIPSECNFKSEYASLRSLTGRINFFNEIVCAYGNDEVYYLKYYDFNGEYNDLVFEVNDGKYSVLTGEDRFEQFMEGTIGDREIRISLFGSENKDSSVLVIEELTPSEPSETASYNGKTAFPMNLYSTEEISYTVFMGMYDGKLSDVKVNFDWGSADIYDLK